METGRDAETWEDVKEQAEQIETLEDVDEVLVNTKQLRATRQKAVLQAIKQRCKDLDDLPELGIGDLEDDLAEISGPDRQKSHGPPELSSLYSNATINKARALLEDGHILKKAKTALDYLIAGEDRTKLGLFLQLLTKDFDEPLMIYGIQKQGEGKSYVAKNVLKLFPSHQVENLTDATQASIYRIEQDEGRDYFKDKIVYFGEIPADEEDRQVFQLFRQLVSEGSISKRLTMQKDGELVSKKLELEGAPAMITTTTDPDRIDPQDMSRGVTYSPSMKQEQYKAVREYQNMQEKMPKEAVIPKKVEDLEEVVKCAVDILSRTDIDVINPFTEDIDSIVPDNIPNIKRDYPKVLRMVGRVPTYLYSFQRPTVKSGTKEYTLTTWLDVVRGLWINRNFINGMLEGRVRSTLDVLETIKDKVKEVEYSYEGLQDKVDELEQGESIEGDSFTNKDVERWMGIAKETARNYTRRLDKMGLIFKDSRSRTHKHYLPQDVKTEKGGITPRTLHGILKSFIEAEGLAEWANLFIRFSDIEGVEEIKEKVGVHESDFPVTIDLGMWRDESFPTPLYMQNSGDVFKQYKSLTVHKKDSNISIGLRGVSKTFFYTDLKELPDNTQDPKQEKDNSAGGTKPKAKNRISDFEGVKHKILDYIEDMQTSTGWVAETEVHNQPLNGEEKQEFREHYNELKNNGFIEEKMEDGAHKCRLTDKLR